VASRRGQIWWVDFTAGRGSEQSGLRPAVVIQNDIGNEYSSTTIVAAVSASPPKRVYPFQVLLPPGEAGLSQPSVVKCDQVLTVDQGRLRRLAGTLTPPQLREVDAALRRSLGL